MYILNKCLGFSLVHNYIIYYLGRVSTLITLHEYVSGYKSNTQALLMQCEYAYMDIDHVYSQYEVRCA